MQKNKPLKDYENIMVFSPGTTVHASQSANRMTYNPQGLKQCEIVQSGQDKFGSIVGKRPSHKPKYTQTQTGYPRMVLDGYKVEGKTVHNTQKPVALCEYLIKTYTNPGEVVLDNCMGSGTTGVACVNTGRRFVGIELDAGYFEIAKKTDRGCACATRFFGGGLTMSDTEKITLIRKMISQFWEYHNQETITKSAEVLVTAINSVIEYKEAGDG